MKKNTPKRETSDNADKLREELDTREKCPRCESLVKYRFRIDRWECTKCTFSSLFAPNRRID